MVKEQPPKGPDKPVTGPRGGKSTVTQTGMYRKNFWLTREQYERLRLLAFRTRRPEAELIREGIDLVLALAETAEEPAAAEAETGDEDEEGEEES